MSRLLPLIGFSLLVALFGFGIWWNTLHEANYVPSPLIDKPAPAFDLPRLLQPDQRIDKAALLGQPYLINVFASWCFACGIEHPVLMNQGRELGVALIGYNYRDERQDALGWLAQHGNPYHMIMVDLDAQTAIDFGIYGAPESFLVDAKGIIRYKHIGPLTAEVIATELLPAINALGSTP